MPLPPAKEVIAEAEAGAGGLFKLALRVMRILETQDKQSRLIESQARQIETLQNAVLVLQAREETLLAKAEAEAIRAAAITVTDLARRVGRIEERSGQN